MWRLLRWGAGALVLSAAVIAFVLSPYGPRHIVAMIAEGYPASVMTHAGRTLRVPGVGEVGSSLVVSPTLNNDLSGPLLRSFQESDGRALVVLHEGQVVLEHHADGYGSGTRFNSFSLVKSLVGALTMRALDDGVMREDMRLDAVLPELRDRSIGHVTVGGLLRMRSGITYRALAGLFNAPMSGTKDKDVERTAYNPFGPMARLHYGDIDRVLGKLAAIPVGETAPFNCQNVNTALLGEVLAEVRIIPLPNLLSRQIWRPAGAGNASWRVYPGNVRVTPYCCLNGTARDWLRAGRFIMRNGTPGAPLLKPATWRRFVMLEAPEAELAKGV